MKPFKFLCFKQRKEASRKREGELREERDRWRTIATQPRHFAAYRYVKGSGIEIGALHRPLHIYNDAQVRYVDRLTAEEIRRTYPKVAVRPQVSVDIVDSGETLGTLGDATCDFVVANHVLEHTRNPIGSVANMLRVLRPNGILYLAIPDKRFTFDIARPTTSYEHLRRDYEEGPDWSDGQHYEEWVQYVGKIPAGAQQQRQAEALYRNRANIHFHAWTQFEIIEMFANMRRDFGFPIEFEVVVKERRELIVVLRKVEIISPASRG
jgi:predicted SAM-dependent methyltransferase